MRYRVNNLCKTVSGSILAYLPQAVKRPHVTFSSKKVTKILPPFPFFMLTKFGKAKNSNSPMAQTDYFFFEERFPSLVRIEKTEIGGQNHTRALYGIMFS